MSRRSARFTEADIARAIKAAERFTPPRVVEILPDGTIRMVPSSPRADRRQRPLEPRKDIVL